MKTIKILLISLLPFMFACQSQDKNIVNGKNNEEISQFLDEWHLAAANADYDSYFGALETNSIYVGTAEEEVWLKPDFEAFSKPYFDKGKAWNFKSISRNIYYLENSNIVYFDEILDTHMGNCRGSGLILRNADDKWIIKHYVLSLVVPNDRLNKVVDLLH